MPTSPSTPPAPRPDHRPDVVLRRWRPEDGADLLVAVRESPDLDRQLPAAAADGAEGCAQVAGALAAWGPRDHHLAVVVGARVVGSVGVGAVEHRHGTAWLSYWLTSSARGQGLASRALATAGSTSRRTPGCAPTPTLGSRCCGSTPEPSGDLAAL